MYLGVKLLTFKKNGGVQLLVATILIFVIMLMDMYFAEGTLTSRLIYDLLRYPQYRLLA